MADAESLTHAFLRAHPAEAARVLEPLPAAEVAALFARTPARLGAPVLAAMLPAAAARSLAALDDERAMALLAALGAQPAAAALRHVPEPRRARLLAGLPGGIAFASQLLLGYPEETVAAWVDADVLVLAAGTSAAEALERARARAASVEAVFVAGTGGRLEGQVPLGALLRAAGTASLDTLMSRSEALLAAQTPLAAAAAHPGWRRASALPVVEASDRLLGVLTRDALERALERPQAAARRESAESLPGMLAAGYWDSLAAVIEAAVALLPRTRPVGRQRE